MASRNYIDPDPAWQWLDQIKIGDILLERGKSERTVREINRYKNGTMRSVSFSILRCSWTHRCYTTVTRSELKTRRFSHSGKRKESASPIDKLIAHDLIYWEKEKQRLDCCDVKGIR